MNLGSLAGLLWVSDLILIARISYIPNIESACKLLIPISPRIITTTFWEGSVCIASLQAVGFPWCPLICGKLLWWSKTPWHLDRSELDIGNSYGVLLIALSESWWWFQICFIFIPIPGVSWSNLTCAYFSRGLGINHQLDLVNEFSQKKNNHPGKSSLSHTVVRKVLSFRRFYPPWMCPTLWLRRCSSRIFNPGRIKVHSCIRAFSRDVFFRQRDVWHNSSCPHFWGRNSWSLAVDWHIDFHMAGWSLECSSSLVNLNYSWLDGSSLKHQPFTP